MPSVDEATSFLSTKTLRSMIAELTEKARSLEKENGELIARVNKLEEEYDDLSEDRDDQLNTIEILKSEFRVKQVKMEEKIADLQAKVPGKLNELDFGKNKLAFKFGKCTFEK